MILLIGFLSNRLRDPNCANHFILNWNQRLEDTQMDLKPGVKAHLSTHRALNQIHSGLKNLSSLTSNKLCKRSSKEPWMSKSQAPIHTIGCEFQCLLSNVHLCSLQGISFSLQSILHASSSSHKLLDYLHVQLAIIFYFLWKKSISQLKFALLFALRYNCMACTGECLKHQIFADLPHHKKRRACSKSNPKG